jgi:hypothetical protein
MNMKRVSLAAAAGGAELYLKRGVTRNRRTAER